MKIFIYLAIALMLSAIPVMASEQAKAISIISEDNSFKLNAKLIDFETDGSLSKASLDDIVLKYNGNARRIENAVTLYLYKDFPDMNINEVYLRIRDSDNIFNIWINLDTNNARVLTSEADEDLLLRKVDLI